MPHIRQLLRVNFPLLYTSAATHELTQDWSIRGAIEEKEEI
jgi:hypothetical protein